MTAGAGQEQCDVIGVEETRGDIDRVVDDVFFSSGLEQAPTEILERGVVLVMTNHMDEAQKEFEASGGSLGRIAWGLVLMQMNRIPEAVDALRRLRDENENDYLANWYLAEALNRYGDRDAEAYSRENRSNNHRRME